LRFSAKNIFSFAVLFYLKRCPSSPLLLLFFSQLPNFQIYEKDRMARTIKGFIGTRGIKAKDLYESFRKLGIDEGRALFGEPETDIQLVGAVGTVCTVTVKVGEPIVLSCQVNSFPTATFTFSFNGQHLTDSDTYRKDKAGLVLMTHALFF
jgi:hypothetical protein